MQQSGGTQRRNVDIAPPRRRPVQRTPTITVNHVPQQPATDAAVPTDQHVSVQPPQQSEHNQAAEGHPLQQNNHQGPVPIKKRAQKRKESREKRVRSARKLEADYEKIGRMMVTVVDAGYKNRFRLYWISFWKGVWAGLGGVVGATIVVALLLWVAGLFTDAPLFGPMFRFFRSFSSEAVASLITRF